MSMVSPPQAKTEAKTRVIKMLEAARRRLEMRTGHCIWSYMMGLKMGLAATGQVISSPR